MRFSSACRARSRSVASSTSSPTTSPTSNTTGYKADTTLFAEYLMPGARDDDFAGNDRRISFVQDRAHLARFQPRRHRAHRQSARRRHRRQRLSRGADAARRALHPQRRAADQRHRPARHQRRLSGAWATAARSRFRPPTTTSSISPTAPSPCAKATARRIRSAASCGSSPSIKPQPLKKDGGSTFSRRPASRRSAGDRHPHRAGRDRKIERARRRRDDAHDRDHPQPTPTIAKCCSSRAISASNAIEQARRQCRPERQ